MTKKLDLDWVQSTIRNGETEEVEFKKSIAELDKLGKALCGQLNAQGGFGFIGITDAGKIVGTEVSDSTKKKITAFKDLFDPWPTINVDYIDLPDTSNQIIAFSCKSSSDEGPYTFRGRPYLKTHAGIKTMPSEQYKKLLLEHVGVSKLWESLSSNHFSIDALDHNEIMKTLKTGISEGRIPEDEYTGNVSDILTHFDLIDNGVVNNAGMVLFAKKMPADFSQCFIRMGRFVDRTMDVVIDSRQVRGNAFQLVNEALDFVKRNLPISSRYNPMQFERIDEMALPFLAVREAIINAICHRDYSIRAGDISLYIFNDCLEIHNIGHLYGGLTVEQLKANHPSRRRNERIAQVFHARKYIDRFGGGTGRILRLCAEQGVPEPVFSEESDGFQVKFMFREAIGAQQDTATPQGLTPRQIEIVTILGTHNGLAPRVLSEKLSTPVSERTLRDELNLLSELGLIKHEGSTNKRRWIRIKK